MSDATTEGRFVAAPGESPPSGEVSPARPLQVTMFILLMATLAVSSAFMVPRSTDVIITGFEVTADRTLDLSLPDGGRLVSGKVIGPSGDALMGVTVELTASDGTLSQGTVTGVRGTFQVAVRPGAYRLALRPSIPDGRGGAGVSRLLPAAAGPFAVQSDTWVGIITLQEGFRVSGRFVTEAGPAEHVYGWLTAVPADGATDGTPVALPLGPVSGSTRFHAVLPAGRFRLLLAGGQAFAANWSMLPMASFGADEIAVSDGASVDVRVGTGARLRGTVSDAAGRRLSGSLWIEQRGTGALQHPDFTLITVMYGAYVTHLPPGSYTAAFLPIADRTGESRGTRTLLGIEMGAGDREAQITVADGFFVSGRVRDARGRVSSGVAVEAIPLAADPHSLASIPIRAVADAETGAYRLCVPAGRYDIHAAQVGMDDVSTFTRLSLPAGRRP